jgi:hypothetical protein
MTLAALIAPGLPWAILCVCLPLAAAVLAPLLAARAGALALPVGLGGVALAGLTAAQTAAHGVNEIHIGGWAPPCC